MDKDDWIGLMIFILVVIALAWFVGGESYNDSMWEF